MLIIQDFSPKSEILHDPYFGLNLHGRYEFSKQPEHVNINDIIEKLSKIHLATLIAD